MLNTAETGRILVIQIFILLSLAAFSTGVPESSCFQLLNDYGVAHEGLIDRRNDEVLARLQSLMVGVKCNDPVETEEFTRKMTSIVWPVVWGEITDTEEALDLLQITLASAVVVAKHRATPGRVIQSTLAGLKSEMRKRLRDSARQVGSPSSKNGNSRRQPAQLSKEEILQAMAHLSARDRQIIEMHIVHHQSAQEIAEALDLSIHTVRSVITRGLATLRRTLLSQGQGVERTTSAWVSWRPNADQE